MTEHLVLDSGYFTHSGCRQTLSRGDSVVFDVSFLAQTVTNSIRILRLRWLQAEKTHCYNKSTRRRFLGYFF